MARPRELDDGSLVYPQRGSPPLCLEGYSIDPGDPYILIPIMPDCKARFQGSYTLKCGKVVEFYTCNKGLTCNGKACKACPVREI